MLLSWWKAISLLFRIAPEIRRCRPDWSVLVVELHMNEVKIIFHYFLGPNELSIRDVDSVDPLLGPNGFQKGPCR